MLQRLRNGPLSRSAREARTALERLDWQHTRQRSAPLPKFQPPKQRLDDFGDPLPAHAMARIGSTRLRHGGWVDKATFSPDGKQLFSSGGDGILRVWDTATGKEIHSLILGTCAEDIAPDGNSVLVKDPRGGLTLLTITGRERAQAARR